MVFESREHLPDTRDLYRNDGLLLLTRHRPVQKSRARQLKVAKIETGSLGNHRQHKVVCYLGDVMLNCGCLATSDCWEAQKRSERFLV